MQNVLIIIHLIVVVALVIVVLLQRSEGGLGLGGGSSSGVGGLMTGRGQTNALTRTTAILGTAFFALSLALTVYTSLSRDFIKSPLDIAPAQKSAPLNSSGAQPTNPENKSGILDELKRFQGDDKKATDQPQVPTSR